MNTKNPIQGFLAHSVRTSWKLVLLALFVILIAGALAVITGVIPENFYAIGLPRNLNIAFLVLIGLAVLLICRTITARLYEKVDL